MDDSPKEFGHEFKSAILKKRVGQIALAVVLAESCIRFLYALTWFLVVPTISSLVAGHSESVLFRTNTVFPWQQLFGSCLEFALAIIFVFYVNRWIRGTLPRPRVLQEPSVLVPPVQEHDNVTYYGITGEPLSPTEQEASRK
jgi:large-conductance mechanosensitive channel